MTTTETTTVSEETTQATRDAENAKKREKYRKSKETLLRALYQKHRNRELKVELYNRHIFTFIRMGDTIGIENHLGLKIKAEDLFFQRFQVIKTLSLEEMQAECLKPAVVHKPLPAWVQEDEAKESKWRYNCEL